MVESRRSSEVYAGHKGQQEEQRGPQVSGEQRYDNGQRKSMVVNNGQRKSTKVNKSIWSPAVNGSQQESA